MTNEQAIAELQKEHDLIQGEHDLDGSQLAPELLEALAMAIEVLKCSEIPNCSEPKCADGCIYGWGSSECGHCDYRSEEPKTGDTISRKAAIDVAIKADIENHGGVLSEKRARIIYKRISAMPPAQPDARYINANELIKRLQQAGLDDAVSIAVKMAGHERLKRVPSAQPDNQVNLCDSCTYQYPDCPSKPDDVIFGNGKGNDNICACNKYKPSAQPEIIQCKDCKHSDWYTTVSGERFCYCMEQCSNGHTENDFCSYAEKEN